MAQYIVVIVLVACFAFCVYADGSAEEISAGNQFKFGQKLVKPVKVVNYTEKLSFKYDTPDQKPIGIYDRLLKRSTFQNLRAYLKSENDAWSFNNHDPEVSNLQKTPDNVPWTNTREPLAFSETTLCQLLIGAVHHRTGKTDQLYPYKVQGKIIRRGDHTLVAPDSTVEGEYSALVFMNVNWHKNHYGELYFYDSAREITAGVTPHGGRVVVWESTILKLNRPPGVSFKQGQLLFSVVFSKSKDKMLEHSREWFDFRKEREEAYKSWYLPDMDLPSDMDVSKHVVRNFTTKQNYKIFVFDNLFPQVMLDKMWKFVLKYGFYFYDDSLDDTYDNVQWIAGFPMQDYVRGAYWKIVKQVAAYSTGSKEYFPYDVSMNLIRNADHPKIHEDCSPDENEWTFILYLTPNWTQNYYGETVFFDANSDDTDIAAEVLPKYGRAVIYQGNIPHSARPPSLNYTGVRLCFASKLSETEFLGRRKNLVKELRHFNGLSATLLQHAVKDAANLQRSSDIEDVDGEEDIANPENGVDEYGGMDGPGEEPADGGYEGDAEGDEGPDDGEDGPEREDGDDNDSDDKNGNDKNGDDKDARPPRKASGKYNHVEEQDDEDEHLPPIAKEFQVKLRKIERNKKAEDAEKLYDTMAKVRAEMRLQSAGHLTDVL